MAWLLPELELGAEPELKPLELEPELVLELESELEPVELEPLELEPLEPEPDEVEPTPADPELEDEPSRPRCPMTWRKRYCAWTQAGPAPRCPPRPRWPW